MKKGNKRNNKNYFSNFLIFVVAFAVATALILPFRTILATYNIPLWNTDGGSTIHKQTGEVVIGDTTPSGTLLLDVAGQIGATEYCDENGANCTLATALGGSADNIHDADNNTIVHTETNANEDIIRFSMGGTEYFNMDGPHLGVDAVASGYSIFIGEGAGVNDDLNSNSNNFIGYYSGNANVTGYRNNALGNYTLGLNNNGHDNVAIGDFSMYRNLSGAWNTATGYSALYYNTIGTNNAAYGMWALNTNTTGSDNVGMGFNAGRWLVSGLVPNETTSSSVYIGSGTRASADGRTNENVFGYSADGIGSNTVVLGNDSIVTTALKGNVGIGTTSPSVGISTLKLDVEGPVGATEYCDENGNNCTAATALGSDASNIHDADNNTIVHTEESANENIIRFDVDGTEKWRLEADGLHTDQWLNRDDNTILGVGAFGAGNLAHSIVGNNGYDNAAFGYQTLYNITEGYDNTATGESALFQNTTGYRNTATGKRSLYSNTIGTYNTATGLYALTSNDTGNGNVANGSYALNDNSTGNLNTASGHFSLSSNTIGEHNVANGYAALYHNVTGSNNTAVGNRAGIGVVGNSFSNNTLIGYEAMDALTIGSDNIALGYRAGDNVTTGSNNLILGYDIDAPVASGSNQLAIGNLIYGTGIDGTGTTVSSGAIGIGDNSPDTGTSTLKLDVEGPVGATEYCDENGNNCTAAAALGSDASNIHDADNNTIVHTEESANENIIRFSTGGTEYFNMDGPHLNVINSGENVFLGNGAGANQDFLNPKWNVFIGENTGFANTTGYENVFMGFWAGQLNTIGSQNTAIGSYSLQSNIDGSANTAIGEFALSDMVGSSGSTAIGYAALMHEETGGLNTALGYRAGTSSSFAADRDTWGNTYIGASAGYNSTGDANLFIGQSTGRQSNPPTTGSNNILLGYRTGDNLLGGSKNILIGDDIDVPLSNGSNQLAIGNLIYGTGIDGTGTTVSSGAIGIGDNSPDTGTSTLKLDVEGPVGATEYCDENGNNCTAAGSLGGFTGTTGSVPFAGAAGSLTEDNANLFWDDTNDRLGVGTNTPAFLLDVKDTIKVNNSGQIGLLDGDPGANAGNPLGAIYLEHNTDETDFYNAFGTNYYASAERWYNTIDAGTLPTSGVSINYTGSWRTPWVTGAHDYATIIGDESEPVYAGTGTVNRLNGYYGYARVSGSGTGDTVIGVSGTSGSDSGATIGNAIGVSGNVTSWGVTPTIAKASALWGGIQSSANITDAYGLRLDNWSATGLITNSYGIYMDSSIDVGTTSYALYSASNSDSYLAGDLGIGTNAPSQQLELTKSIELVETTASDEGVIYKGGVSFMHNFNPPDNGTVDPLGYNTFVGLNAGNFTMGSTATLNTESSSNNAFGISAMASNTTGYENSAVGGLSLYSNTNGFRNTASGQEALYSNLGGYANSAHGRSALYSNTTGYYNTAQGMNALYSNTTGYLNSAHGHGSLHYSQNGVGNTTQGAYSGRGTALYTGSDNNTVLGYFAGYNMSSNMDNNILVGSRAGYNHTSGSNNIVIGYNMDAATLTGSNQMSIGNLIYGTGINGTGTTISSGDIGIGRVPTTNRLEVAGDASKNVAGSWLANSDERLKTNIEQLNSRQMLDQILSLRGVSYEWNDDKTDMERPTGIQYGMIAQEIDDVFPSLVSEDAGGYLQTAYGTYDAMLIEAIRGLREEKDEQITALKDEKDREIKELREENAVQAQQITDLNEQNQNIIKRLETLEQK